MADDEKGKRSREAYRKGAEDSKSASGWGHFFHEVDDFIGNFTVPDFRNSKQRGEDKAYDAGWHDYEDKKYRYKKREKRERKSRSESSSSSSSSSTSAGGFIVFLIIAGIVGVALYSMDISDVYKKWEVKKQGVGTTASVNTEMMNIRSSPSAKSDSVGTFPIGTRLNIISQPVANGNDKWVQVSTEDGRTQGWANLKLLGTTPQLEELSKEQGGRSEAQEQQPSSEPTNGSTSTPAAEPSPNVTYIPRSAAPPPPTPTPIEIITVRNGQIVPVDGSPSQSSDPRATPTPEVTIQGRRVIVGPGIKLLPKTPEQENSAPQPSEPEPSDGTPRLKRRPPQ